MLLCVNQEWKVRLLVLRCVRTHARTHAHTNTRAHTHLGHLRDVDSHNVGRCFLYRHRHCYFFSLGGGGGGPQLFYVFDF